MFDIGWVEFLLLTAVVAPIPFKFIAFKKMGKNRWLSLLLLIPLVNLFVIWNVAHDTWDNADGITGDLRRKGKDESKLIPQNTQYDDPSNQVKSGLGGWLVLVGIGVVLSPFKLVFVDFLPNFLPMFRDGSFEFLSNPESENYIPFFAPLVYGEICYNIAMTAATIYLIFLFFFKKQFFPRFYISILIISFVSVLVDAVLVKFVFPEEPIFSVDTIKTLVQVGIVAAIWVPYLLISKRVKATFVN